MQPVVEGQVRRGRRAGCDGRGGGVFGQDLRGVDGEVHAGNGGALRGHLEVLHVRFERARHLATAQRELVRRVQRAVDLLRQLDG